MGFPGSSDGKASAYNAGDGHDAKSRTRLSDFTSLHFIIIYSSNSKKRKNFLGFSTYRSVSPLNRDNFTFLHFCCYSC